MSVDESEPTETIPVNILAVDDRPENHVAIRAMLSLPGYRIIEARSASEALRRLLGEDEFAVLLIDVVMPEMTGLELATAIKQRKRTAAIPIVFMTVPTSDVQLLYQGYQAGAVDYLIRPLVPEMVRAKVAVFAELYRQKKYRERQDALLLAAERQESELRLLELRLASERRYRCLAEAVPHIIWTAGPDGPVDYFNQRWFEYTGLSAEASVGSWEGAVHGDDLARCRTAWREARQSGHMLQVECRLRRASAGTFRWHLCRAVPERGPSGEILSWLGTFTDIEDQKRAQAVLAEFKGTLDAVLDAVLIFDPGDEHLLYVNQAAGRLLGCSTTQLLQMRPADLLAEPDNGGARDLLAPLRQGNKTDSTTETKFLRSDGRVVPVEVSLQLIEVDGGRIVAIARDITARKRQQRERDLLYREAVDAVHARDEFLSVASHELKTPLAALQLQIQLILRPSRRDSQAALSPEQARAKLESANKQVERLARLIAELMDVSRIKVGRLRMSLEQTELSGLVREVVDHFGDEAARVQCPVTVTAKGPVVGKWDKSRVEQVLTNLLANAFKFGPGKPVEVSVEERGPVARLLVTDHGIGIAAEDADRIFHRYEQAASSREYGGLGLGLYIARQIIEAHGGTIRVESEPGKGSTFVVELPREPARARPQEAQGKAAQHGNRGEEVGHIHAQAHPNS